MWRFIYQSGALMVNSIIFCSNNFVRRFEAILPPPSSSLMNCFSISEVSSGLLNLSASIWVHGKYQNGFNILHYDFASIFGLLGVGDTRNNNLRTWSVSSGKPAGALAVHDIEDLPTLQEQSLRRHSIWSTGHRGKLRIDRQVLPSWPNMTELASGIDYASGKWRTIPPSQYLDSMLSRPF